MKSVTPVEYTKKPLYIMPGSTQWINFQQTYVDSQVALIESLLAGYFKMLFGMIIAPKIITRHHFIISQNAKRYCLRELQAIKYQNIDKDQLFLNALKKFVISSNEKEKLRFYLSERKMQSLLINTVGSVWKSINPSCSQEMGAVIQNTIFSTSMKWLNEQINFFECNAGRFSILHSRL